MSKILSAELKLIEHAIKSAEHINLALGYSSQENYKTVALTQLKDAMLVEKVTGCLPRNLSKLIPDASELITDNRSHQGVSKLYEILRANNISYDI